MALCIHFVGTNFSQGEHRDLYERSLDLLTLFLVKTSYNYYVLRITFA